jgi:hypothetical protein
VLLRRGAYWAAASWVGAIRSNENKRLSSVTLNLLDVPDCVFMLR